MSEEKEKKLSKEEIAAFIKDIEQKISKNSEAHLHSLIALNKIMRAPNIDTVMDKKLKDKIKVLWGKLKAAGVNLADPPLIFGLPQNFSTAKKDEEESEYLTEYADEEFSKKKVVAAKKTKKTKAEKASSAAS